jgi:hypothetical protein
MLFFQILTGIIYILIGIGCTIGYELDTHHNYQFPMQILVLTTWPVLIGKKIYDLCA